MKKDEKHCKKVMQEHFNKDKSKKVVKRVKRIPLSKISQTIKRKLSKEEIKSNIKTERKSSIRVYEVDVKGMTKINSRMLIVGKKYKNISSDHTNKGFPMFVESESLKLCNEVYEKRSPLDNLFPKFYAYDRGVLFKEYIGGESLTKIISYGNKEIEKRESKINSINEKINSGDINPDNLKKIDQKKDNIKGESEEILVNLKNLMHATVETLADFHETVHNSSTNGDKSYVINRLERHNFAQEFADLSLELSHQIGIKNKNDKNWWIDIFNSFYNSPVSDYLENPSKSHIRFLIGDYYSDNILVNLDSIINSENEESIRKAITKQYDRGASRSNGLYNPSELWKRTLRLYDLGKCIEGPVGLDLSDLLNIPYISVGKNFIDDQLDTYRNFSDKFRTKKTRLDKGHLRKSFGYCSIPRLIRSAVNENLVSHKKNYLNSLNENLNKYKGFKRLKNKLNQRNLFDETMYDQLEESK